MTTLQFTPKFGLTFPAGFQLDSSSIEQGGDLVPAVLLSMLLARDEAIPLPEDDNLLLSHALMLFANLANDSAFDGITPDQLFAACCDTVLIWCDG